MSLSFKEKSLWLMFVSLVTAFGFYFATALPPASTSVLPHQVAVFVVALGVLVIAQIAGHVLIAIVDRRTAGDERDRLIAFRGTRTGAIVLGTGVFVSLCTALLTVGNFVFTHVLLAFWVLAELADIGTQLILYRRGM